MNRLRSLPPLLPALLCGLAAGCGTGSGEVSGTVRHNGKPLPHGTIQFLGSDGIPCAAQIQSDGTFSIRVPAGPAKVIVSCVDESRLNRLVNKSTNRKGRVTPVPGSDENFSLIPKRYADWDASGLTAQVEPGQTAMDFNLVSN